MVGAAVEHRGQHSPHLELAVGEAPHVVDGVEQLPDAAVRQRLALERDQHAVGCGQGRHGQHTEGGWAVEQHPVVVDVVVGQRVDRDLDDLFATGPRQQVGLGARQLNGGGQQVHAVRSLHDGLGGVEALGQDVVHGDVEVFGVDAEREGQAGLGVEVHQEDRVPQLDQRSTDRGHRGGLGNAALLVGDREGRRSCPGHRGPLCPTGLARSGRHLFAGGMTYALVTGATAGIGLEFSRQLAERGHDLVLVARNEEGLAAVAAELRAAYAVQVEILAADLIVPEQCALVEARLADRGRPVDLLVNNAGFGLKGRFGDNSIEDEQAMLDVLVTSVLRLSHAALGPMAERGRGGIINVSSVAAWLPRGTYSAAKAYVNLFSEWAHNEYKPHGVTVMSLCPGFTKTEFHQRMKVKRGDGFMWLEPEFLVKKALSDYDKGRVYSVPGAQYKAIRSLTRVIPSVVLQRTQSMGRK